jgi:cell division septum initiation protein DivIVA
MENDRQSNDRNREQAAAVPAGWATNPVPTPSSSVQATIDEMSSQMRTVIDAAERAADAIRVDAEDQARRHLAEAQRKADRLTAERVALISELTDDLLRQAANVRDHSEQMVAALEAAIGSFTDRLEHPRTGQYFDAPDAPPVNGSASVVEGGEEVAADETRAEQPERPPAPEPIGRRTAPPEAVASEQRDEHRGAAAYTDIIGVPPPPPAATAPAPVAPGYERVSEPTGAPQPIQRVAEETAAHGSGEAPRTDNDSEIPLDVIMYATRRAANGVAPEMIASELQLRYGVEDPAPIIDRVIGRGGQPG